MKLVNSVGIAVQGGGMRSAYAMGALCGIAEAVDRERVGMVSGGSGGALTLAYYLCGRHERGVEVFYKDLAQRRFINPRRFWKVVDVDYLVDEVLRLDLPDLASHLAAGPAFRVPLTSWPSGELSAVYLGDCPDLDPYEVLRASAAIPILYNRPVELRGDRFLDGALTDSIPLFELYTKRMATAIVVLTRPVELGSGHLDGFLEQLAARFWPRLGIGIRRTLLAPNQLTIQTLEALRNVSPPELVLIAPDLDTYNYVGRTTIDSGRLRELSRRGMDDALSALSKVA